MQLDLVAVFEARPEQERKGDIGQRIEEAELGELLAFEAGEIARHGPRLDMDHPHSGDQEEWEQQEDRRADLAVQRELIVVRRPTLRDGQDHPQDGAGRMIMVGDFLFRQLREISRPECDKGECEQHQHPKPCFAIRHCPPAFLAKLRSNKAAPQAMSASHPLRTLAPAR